MNGWQIAGCVALYVIGMVVTSSYAHASGAYDDDDPGDDWIFCWLWPIGAVCLLEIALTIGFSKRIEARQEREEARKQEAERRKEALKEMRL